MEVQLYFGFLSREKKRPKTAIFTHKTHKREEKHPCHFYIGIPSPGGGGVLPYKRLMGMCRRVGSHFHHWIDYNGVAFSIELLGTVSKRT